MEFKVSQFLITALGGELERPLYVSDTIVGFIYSVFCH